MKILLGRSYFISKHLILIVGLKRVNNVFEPTIGLSCLLSGEKILMEAANFGQFKDQYRQLMSYFAGEKFQLKFKFPKLEVLVCNSFPKELIIKSKSSVNFVRLDELQVRKLCDTTKLVKLYLKKIQKKTNFVEFLWRQIVFTVKQELFEDEQEIREFIAESNSQDAQVPPVSCEDVVVEVKRQSILTNNPIMSEIFFMYEKELIDQIFSEVSLSKEIFDKMNSFDVPF